MWLEAELCKSDASLLVPHCHTKFLQGHHPASIGVSSLKQLLQILHLPLLVHVRIRTFITSFKLSDVREACPLLPALEHTVVDHKSAVGWREVAILDPRIPSETHVPTDCHQPPRTATQSTAAPLLENAGASPSAEEMRNPPAGWKAHCGLGVLRLSAKEVPSTVASQPETMHSWTSGNVCILRWLELTPRVHRHLNRYTKAWHCVQA
mmetsp:Transcript_117172/g.269075  ORF Transcript_117172/g.269075 Transcript_117172/m.269075 type:complete len:208 (-) Transcript_117172:43-666(-)